MNIYEPVFYGPLKSNVFARLFFGLFLICFNGVWQPAYSRQQEPADPVDREQRIKKLEEQVELLSDQIARLKLKEATGNYASFSGLSPAASQVYYNNPGLSFGGYGEFKYRNWSLTDRSLPPANVADIHRIILYTGYKFNDSVVLNTEVEYEHAGFIDNNDDSREPAVFVEFANIDFLLTDLINLRAGLILIPMGLVNQLHEPVVFRGVDRPAVETRLIPSTWREVGLMLHGKDGRFSYNAGLVNGQTVSGMSTHNWLGGSKQSGSLDRAESLAAFIRLDWRIFNTAQTGFSAYHGGAGQDILPGKANVTLVDVHLDLQYQGFRLRAMAVWGQVSDIEEINLLLSNRAGERLSVGQMAGGALLEAGYDLAEWLPFKQSLIAFIRLQKYDLQLEAAPGLEPDLATRVTIVTTDFDFFVVSRVVIKADYSHEMNGLPSMKSLQSVNLGTGFIF